MNARRLAALLVAALALVAAGCGGSSDEASSDTTTAAVETTTTEATTTEDMTTTDTATDTTNADLGALTGKCAELAGLGTKLAAAMGGQDAGVADVSKVFDELADEVPDEIKADWQVLAENFGKIAEALKGVDLTNGGTPDAETLAKLQELSTTLDSQEVQQASAHIEAWVTQNC
jgi:ABC-type glycerol-3-phosphate transport system substrate-binding protein